MIEDTYNKVISLGITPCFMYTTFSHKEEHHKFRMIFCNDTVITDGNIRDRLQATLMGIIGGIDEVSFNRDRLFFGGKGQVVLHPDYEARINLQDYLKALYYEENDHVRAVEYIFKNIYLAYDIKNEDLQLKYIEEMNQISKNVNNKEIVLNNENYLKLLIEDIEKEEQLSKQFNQNSFLFKAIGIILLIFLVVLCILVIYIRIIKKRIKYDPLTKIYNRGYFDKRYYELLNRKNKFSVIMIDIDNFKKLNDTYGHKFGDTVLVNCCNVMSNLHSGEFELFRYGGEEIVVLLKDKSKKEVIMIAESIRRIIEDLIWEEEVKVTASLGIAYSEECGYKTLEIADKNLYKAKNSGKNRVVFN